MKKKSPRVVSPSTALRGFIKGLELGEGIDVYVYVFTPVFTQQILKRMKKK